MTDGENRIKVGERILYRCDVTVVVNIKAPRCISDLFSFQAKEQLRENIMQCLSQKDKYKISSVIDRDVLNRMTIFLEDK